MKDQANKDMEKVADSLRDWVQYQLDRVSQQASPFATKNVDPDFSQELTCAPQQYDHWRSSKLLCFLDGKSCTLEAAYLSRRTDKT